MRSTLINGRWPLILPDHRADFHEERPWWEAARLTDMYAHLDPGDLLVDVGSEEGDLTALYASWGALVFFIDPSQPWIEQTAATLAANQLGDAGFAVAFAAEEDQYGTVTITTPRFGVLDEESLVERVAIDSLELPRVAAMTIDVEGSERRVLRGAVQTIVKDAPIVWVSIHEDVDPHSATPSKVHEFMRELGYKDQFLAYDHEWHYRFWKP